jgi:hypothetical protein
MVQYYGKYIEDIMKYPTFAPTQGRAFVGDTQDKRPIPASPARWN